jgi:predicted DNA-binding WGR domain protein
VEFVFVKASVAYERAKKKRDNEQVSVAFRLEATGEGYARVMEWEAVYTDSEGLPLCKIEEREDLENDVWFDVLEEGGSFGTIHRLWLNKPEPITHCNLSAIGYDIGKHALCSSALNQLPDMGIESDTRVDIAPGLLVESWSANVAHSAENGEQLRVRVLVTRETAGVGTAKATVSCRLLDTRGKEVYTESMTRALHTEQVVCFEPILNVEKSQNLLLELSISCEYAVASASVVIPVEGAVDSPDSSVSEPAAEAEASSTPRRFELVTESANKFWSIDQQGSAYTVHYGRIGTKGQSKTKAFDTAEEARFESAKVIQQKVKKGYLEVGVAAQTGATMPPVHSPGALTEFSPDRRKFAAFQVFMEDHGMAEDSHAEWPNNILSKRTVVFSNGVIARSGAAPFFDVDPDELARCKRLSKTAAERMKGQEVGMGSESGDGFFSFFMAANIGASPAEALDAEWIRSKFNSALFPNTPITVEPLEADGIWWSEVSEDGEGEDEYLAPWRKMGTWFGAQAEFCAAVFVRIGFLKDGFWDMDEDSFPPGTELHPACFMRLAIGVTPMGSVAGICGPCVQT